MEQETYLLVTGILSGLIAAYIVFRYHWDSDTGHNVVFTTTEKTLGGIAAVFLLPFVPAIALVCFALIAPFTSNTTHKTQSSEPQPQLEQKRDVEVETFAINNENER